MASYTGTPVRWDHTLICGDTYQPGTVTLKDGNGTAYSLVGASGVASVKTVPGGAAVLSPTVTITDAANGTFTWSDTAAHTAAIAPGEYWYWVRLTFADGTVVTVLEGQVRALPSGF